MSKYEWNEEERTVFHVGYCQDNSDRPDHPNPSAGHCQSLEVVPGKPVQCFGIYPPDPEPVTSPPLITNTTATSIYPDIIS